MMVGRYLRRCAAGWWFVAVAGVAAGQGADDLVRQLGDDSYRVREEASAKLWEMGEKAMEVLERAGGNQDPEVAFRARILLQRIQTGILPGTPQEIVELVQRYHRGGAATKRAVMEQLAKVGAYAQILRLYRFERDAEARDACAELVNEVLVKAVDAELLKGDVDAAEALLEAAPPGEANFRLLAALYRVMGKLDQKLAESDAILEGEGMARMGDGEARQFREMRLALLRSKGDVASARRLAEEMNRDDLVASLDLFEGNPIPYLNWFIEHQTSPVSRLHAEIVRERWMGNAEVEAKLMNAVKTFADGAGEDSEEAVFSMLLLGDTEEALPLVAASPKSIFDYYDTVELPLQAAVALGYGAGAGVKKRWIEERLAVLRADWGDAEDQLIEILDIASFLQKRGETEEAWDVIQAVSEVASGEGPNEWLGFLGQVGDREDDASYELAFRMAAARLEAEGEEADALPLLGSLFGEGQAARRLWETLADVTDDGPAERMRLLGALYGRVPLANERMDALVESLLDGADQAPAGDRRQMLADLLEPAMTRDSAADVVDLLERLAAIDGKERWVKLLATFYGYLAEWDKAVAAWEFEVEQDETRDLFVLCSYAGALVRAGRKKEADEVLHQLDMRSLDEPMKLRGLAYNLETWGAREEAAIYWKRLAITGSPADLNWQYSVAQGVGYARERGDWRVAASFAEVLALGYLRSETTLLVNPVSYLRARFTADMYRGLAMIAEDDVRSGRELLEASFEMLIGDGMLADDFFPLIRGAGLVEFHDRSFARGYQRINESIRAYPRAHNTYNSAAWLASRASRELDDALGKIRKALEMRPRQAAYLDTMAEVWFAKGDRERAVEWSRKAVRKSYHASHSTGGGVELREQFERFQNGDFPAP